MPVEGEIINVYDVFEMMDHTVNCYREPVGHFTHIFFALGRRSVPAGALTAPLRHIQLCIYRFAI